MKWLEEIRPILTTNQLDRLSNIFDNAGQVFLAVVVLSPLVGSIDRVNLLMLTSGIMAVLVCWIVSILLIRRSINEI